MAVQKGTAVYQAPRTVVVVGRVENTKTEEANDRLKRRGLRLYLLCG